MANEYPTFQDLEVAVQRGAKGAQLMWMALSKLSTQGEFTSYMPEEVYAEMVKIAKEVYGDPNVGKAAEASEQFIAENPTVPTVDVPEVE